MERRWCEGHSAPVLCVGAAGGPEGLLASGAEGGEVTLWTQEGVPLAALHLHDAEDVTCAVFSPSAPGLLYVSHGETVSVFDPRNTKEAVEKLQVGEDEINGLSLNETGQLLAAADDSGAVRVVELDSGKVSRTLRRHTNICSSVAFRPLRPQSLLSVGLDMQVMLWSLQKARPLWAVNLQDMLDVEEGKQQTTGKLFNPPLAHCVSVATCGNAVACAAEDGRVHLLRVGSGSRPEMQVSFQAHSQGVSQAHFLSFLSHPYWLATGGNDGQVALWDVSGAGMVTEGKGKPKAAAHRRKPKGRPPTKPKSQAHPEELGEKVDSDPDPEKASDTGPKLSISHGDKINWVCPAVLKGEPSLLVADQSCTLTVYSLAGL